MFKIDYYDEKNMMLDKLAKGEWQNSLVQTNESVSFGVQTVKM